MIGPFPKPKGRGATEHALVAPPPVSHKGQLASDAVVDFFTATEAKKTDPGNMRRGAKSVQASRTWPPSKTSGHWRNH